MNGPIRVVHSNKECKSVLSADLCWLSNQSTLSCSTFDNSPQVVWIDQNSDLKPCAKIDFCGWRMTSWPPNAGVYTTAGNWIFSGARRLENNMLRKILSEASLEVFETNLMTYWNNVSRERDMADGPNLKRASNHLPPSREQKFENVLRYRYKLHKLKMCAGPTVGPSSRQ